MKFAYKERERERETGERERKREREIYSPPRLSSRSFETYSGSQWIRSTHLPPDNCSVGIALRSPPKHNIAPSKLPPINLFVRDVLYISICIYVYVYVYVYIYILFFSFVRRETHKNQHMHTKMK